MRAVFSVIKAAGSLKRKYKDDIEDKLVLKALKDVNVPKFLSNDLVLFDNIILDLFPGIEQPKDDYGLLVESLRTSIRTLGFEYHDYFVRKVYQLYDTINVRHGLMLVGPAGGGKTTNYKCLQHAWTALKNEDGFAQVLTDIINPKGVTMGQLYGYLNQ